MPFGLGFPELLVILAIILIFFGAGKLPELGRTLGSGIRNFQKSVRGEDEEENANKELPPSSSKSLPTNKEEA